MRSSEAADAAAAFHAAADDADYEGACAMLTRDARTTLEDGQEGSCPVRLAATGLGRSDTAGGVVSSRVFGRNAQVIMKRDTLFLTLAGGRWKVTGAGCVARDERPYKCEVEGN
ncbi:BRCT domain-containing protein [Arthrobacter pityocampae]|uniref:hypothetical protein n=1 Tax=Arthrobacter pityocampae TaxID=547334 RepID=UPI003735E230